MLLLKTINDLRRWRQAQRQPVGFVPTMGYLHEGHLSLVRQAQRECPSVLVSIFVNPLQFGPQEDLSKYPRDEQRDWELLSKLNPEAVWMPSAPEIYPSGFTAMVKVGAAAQVLEGARRPGHFDGVATIVTKLFHAAGPQRAYFGQKDAQQAGIIKKITADLNFPIEIIVCPTVRESSGLALSSRNSYLTPEQKKTASILYRSLKAAQFQFERGERCAEKIKKQMTEILSQEPLCQVDYVSIAHPLTFQELEKIESNALFSLAVRIGPARLIDNFLLENEIWETGIMMEETLDAACR